MKIKSDRFDSLQRARQEYDAETEYPAGALCKNTDNYGGIVIYKALKHS